MKGYSSTPPLGTAAGRDGLMNPKGSAKLLKRKVKKKKKKKKAASKRKAAKDKEPVMMSLSDHLLMMAGGLSDEQIKGSIIPSENPFIAKVSTEERVSRADKIDPAWIYPVGSNVIHTRFGQGQVTLAPKADRETEMAGEPTVRVKFEDGFEADIPVMGKELMPN